MNEQTKKRLQNSLSQAITSWIELNAEEGIEFPYLGVSVPSIMADAAFAVLMGIVDTEDYLYGEGLLSDD